MTLNHADGEDLFSDFDQGIRNHETQESKDSLWRAPTSDEMQAIIRRFRSGATGGQNPAAPNPRPADQGPARPRVRHRRQEPPAVWVSGPPAVSPPRQRAGGGAACGENEPKSAFATNARRRVGDRPVAPESDYLGPRTLTRVLQSTPLKRHPRCALPTPVFFFPICPALVQEGRRRASTVPKCLSCPTRLHTPGAGA